MRITYTRLSTRTALGITGLLANRRQETRVCVPLGKCPKREKEREREIVYLYKTKLAVPRAMGVNKPVYDYVSVYTPSKNPLNRNTFTPDS